MTKMTPEKYNHYLTVSQDTKGCPDGFKSLGPGFERYSECHSVYFGNTKVNCYHCGDLVYNRTGAYPNTTYYTPTEHWNKIMEENKPKDDKMKTIEEIVKLYNEAIEALADKPVTDTTGGYLGTSAIASKADFHLVLKNGPGYDTLSGVCDNVCRLQGYVIGVKFKTGHMLPIERLKLFIPEIKVKNWKTGKEYAAQFHPGYVQFGCAKVLNYDINECFTHLHGKIGTNPSYKEVKGFIIGDGLFTHEIISELAKNLIGTK